MPSIAMWRGSYLKRGRLDELLGHSITYRIAVGPHVGRKVFTPGPLVRLRRINHASLCGDIEGAAGSLAS